MPKAQKHCKLHDFYAWTVPKKQEKWPKIDQKTPNKNLQNASSNFTLFFPTPNPQKRENPSRLKDFRGGSAAGARPRVAKAMLSFPHYTARHRRILYQKMGTGCAMVAMIAARKAVRIMSFRSLKFPEGMPQRGSLRDSQASTRLHSYLRNTLRTLAPLGF